MAKVEYSDIVFLEKLNEIKTTIQSSGFRIDYRKAYEVDKVMRDVIDHLYDERAEDKSLIDLYNKLDLRVNRRSMFTLVYYYFALYQNNLPLLCRMLQEDIGLFDEDDRFSFELLDRNFSQYFPEDQYIYLIRNCKEELMSFYHLVFAQNHSQMDMSRRRELYRELRRLSEKLFSTEVVLPEKEKKACEARLDEISDELKHSYVYKYSEEERDSFCKEFARIMTKNPFVCKCNQEELNVDYYSHLLSPEVFAAYDEEHILQMGDYEKKYVSDYSNHPAILARVKQIFQTHPDFHTMIKLSPELLRLFTDEELSQFNSKQIYVYEKAMGEGYVTRLKNIESQNQKIIEYPAMIHPSIFETLSDEEISQMSEKAIGKISHLVAHTRFFNPDEEYKLKRKSVWIMKVDRVIQKVKKFLT